MAQRTTADAAQSREDLAAYFEHLAAEFRAGGEDVDIDVGNKTVSLSPPETIETSVDVIERSTMFRGNRETVRIELNWKSEQ
ncbi:uncharacterized protein Nmag_2848 [Natrialba magadii ATCC 43099]|uniref:Amphi-Trp domain-containing protein n=1 Tax=Natrialba magadii (strain ATCC 43099 / DSM 3394 / CCM 3739 / CIP 104546 / IAM 13178 / JCM 8861 / NBRC 102185 / NCIMB 2190 / MS3) TaxID=547559 RepID=D3T0C2_NATMM|nr:amphi-Trp domain-containing protein [Natrialba magadii]ADD06401.1 uncharacterized protein Nmag_2848 [Natrialba magadii ATCC 43099]ELY31572.1 hypothetical protein C500_06164 [Natrialba magadii ATCC 43099]